MKFQSLLLAIAAALVFSCFYPYRQRALKAMGLRSSTPREVTLVIYIMLLTGIAAEKLFPVYVWKESPGIWGDLILLIERPTSKDMLNLIPFQSIYQGFQFIQYGTASLGGLIANWLANVILFVPLGLFPALLFQNASWKRSFWVCFALALFTEAGQYLVMRYASVDDLILSVLGGLCGYWFYLYLRRYHLPVTQLFLCRTVEN